MARVIWSTPARLEFDVILATIRREAGPHHAEKWRRRFEKALATIQTFPESGSPVEEFPWKNWRESIVGPYRIIYRFDGTNCRVLSAVRAERDLTQRFPEDGDDEPQ
jgi:plasmid stabilization system protein ParE